MKRPTDLSIILTHRSTDAFRDRNLGVVLQHVRGLPDAEIILVEQDRHERAALSDLVAGVEHVFAFNPGLFNHSWGFNVGAVRARGRVLMLMDGDLIVEHWAVQAALDACRSGVTAVNPYAVLIDLSSDDSDRVAVGEPIIDRMRSQGAQRKNAGEHPPFCGGAYLIDAEFYREIGGQDERFLNWGGEDDAMTTKVLRLAPRAIQITASTAYHLYHPRPDHDRSGHPQYQRNTALLGSYDSMSDEQLLETTQSTIGDPEKYRTDNGIGTCG